MLNAHITKIFQPSDNAYVCVCVCNGIWRYKIVTCVVIVMRTIATSITTTRKMYEKLENLLQLVHYSRVEWPVQIKFCRMGIITS